MLCHVTEGKCVLRLCSQHRDPEENENGVQQGRPALYCYTARGELREGGCRSKDRAPRKWTTPAIWIWNLFGEKCSHRVRFGFWLRVGLWQQAGAAAFPVVGFCSSWDLSLGEEECVLWGEYEVKVNHTLSSTHTAFATKPAVFSCRWLFNLVSTLIQQQRLRPPRPPPPKLQRSSRPVSSW